MRPILCILVILLSFSAYCRSSRPLKNTIDTSIQKVVVRFDPNVLRIPGNSIPIGITTVLENGRVVETKGFLGGDYKWKNYRIESQAGKFFCGKLKLNKDENYKRNEAIVVNVYSRKGKNLLRTQRIPFNYETDIQILEDGNYALAPGNQIKLGVRTFFNNDMYRDTWLNTSDWRNKGFGLKPEGGCIEGGKLVINSDPFTIQNHTVKLATFLIKERKIADTLCFTLDYLDRYLCLISACKGSDGFSGFSGLTGFDGSNGGHGCNGCRGPDLDVFADVYFDTIIHEELMYVRVIEIETDEIHNYLINTRGGLIQIVSQGGRGGDGGDGGRGGSGVKGEEGTYYTETVWVNDSTSTSVTKQGPGGMGGDGGHGGNGGYGGHGGNGGDIFITYTFRAEPFLYMIDVQSNGGRGGSSGWGGSGGSGGSGGAGDPPGQSGNSGCSGSSGESGNSGGDGEVYYNVLLPDEE
jgi:hypothetical protein